MDVRQLTRQVDSVMEENTMLREELRRRSTSSARSRDGYTTPRTVENTPGRADTAREAARILMSSTNTETPVLTGSSTAPPGLENSLPTPNVNPSSFAPPAVVQAQVHEEGYEIIASVDESEPQAAQHSVVGDLPVGTGGVHVSFENTPMYTTF